MNLNYNNFFKATSFITSVVVFFSFFLEYYFALTPCKLCIIQRYLWIFFTFFCYIAVLQKSLKNLITSLSILFIVAILLTSFYHSIIEAGVIENIFACSSATGLDAKSIEELSEVILNTTNNDCEFPKFSIYGITLANLGVLLSLIILTFNLLLLRKLLSL